MCCLAIGSRRSALGRIPTAKVTSSPRWCAGASLTPSATHAVLLVHGFTDYFFHTELADHFAARGFACLRAGYEQVREVMARGADAALHHRPRALRRRTGAGAGPHRRRVSGSRRAHLRAFHGRPDRPAVAGPHAAPRRHRQTSHRRPGAQQPVAGSAGACPPAHCPGGASHRRGLAHPQEAGGPAAGRDRGRIRRHPAQASTAASSTTT